MARKRRKTFFDESAMLNNRAYNYYMTRFSELALSVFKWKGLPDSIDERFLELTLYSDGQAVFFKDEVLGYLCLQAAVNGPFDVYRVPIRRRAYAANGYQKQLNRNDSVIIWNNKLHTNTEPDMRVFARRLWDLDRTIEVNARAQKTPVMLQGPEEQRLTLLNMYKEYDGNAPVICGDKNLNLEGFKSINTQAPFVGLDLYQLKTQIWNEALTYLGISNLTIQKKERVNTDEVTRSMGGTLASRNARLEARKKAAEEINKMFDLDISVHFKEDLDSDEAPEEPEEVREDVEVYD